AQNPEVMARWTPVERIGSMKQAESPARSTPGPLSRRDRYDQSRAPVTAVVRRAAPRSAATGSQSRSVCSYQASAPIASLSARVADEEVTTPMLVRLASGITQIHPVGMETV